MIVYEVRVSVDPEVAAAYRTWLEAHVREILGISGFTGAELLSEEDADARRVWVIRYHLDSRTALETYLREHAPRMRADGERRFGGRFSATRRVLEMVRAFHT